MERITDPRKQILQLLIEFSYLGICDFYRLLRNESPSFPSHQRRVRRLLHDFADLGYLRSFPLIDRKRRRKYTVDDRHSLFLNLWTSRTL